MTSFEAYEIYLAIKLHFESPTYDFQKFNGKTRVTEASFQKRKDRYFFEKAAARLSKEHYIHRLLVQLREKRSTMWIRDIFENENLTKTLVMEDYLKRYSIKFEEDLIALRTVILTKGKLLSDLLVPESGYSYVFRRYMAGEFLPEFLFGLNHALSLFRSWDKSLNEDPVWAQEGFFLKKYETFVYESLPNKTELRKILVDKFQGL